MTTFGPSIKRAAQLSPRGYAELHEKSPVLRLAIIVNFSSQICPVSSRASSFFQRERVGLWSSNIDSSPRQTRTNNPFNFRTITLSSLSLAECSSPIWHIWRYMTRNSSSLHEAAQQDPRIPTHHGLSPMHPLDDARRVWCLPQRYHPPNSVNLVKGSMSMPYSSQIATIIISGSVAIPFGPDCFP